MRRLLFLATVAALVVAGGGVSASTKRVSITDTALSPSAVVISLGDSVRWTNKGSRQHRVKSAQGTFAAFTLQPGKGKTVKFARRGCERYEVDDRLNGRVLVGVASCPGGTSPPSPGGGGGGGNPPPPSPKPGTTSIVYDITIKAKLHTIETRSLDLPEENGVTDLDLVWTGKWKRLPLVVTTEEDEIAFRTTSGTKRGTIGDAMLKFSDTRQTRACNGRIEFGQLRAHASLYGSKHSSQYTKAVSMSFDAGVDDSTPVSNRVRAAEESKCKGHYVGMPAWKAQLPLTILGLDVDPPGGHGFQMETHWSHQARTGTPFPFSRIVRGQGFTIESGIRTARVSEPAYSMRFEGSVKYVFTPVS